VINISTLLAEVMSNTNQGTDHGTAGPILVAGSPVRGGFIGEQPSLTNLDNGDLKRITDFRDIYATLITDVLRTDPEPVLEPGRTMPDSPISRLDIGEQAVVLAGELVGYRPHETVLPDSRGL
jgi:Protein of unknown function (DUF1501)